MKQKKVLIFGGTHGNEWTGVYAIKKFAESLKKEFAELQLEFIHANPEAFKINKRFKDEDLNRAFQYLSQNRENSYEHQRAKEIRRMILEEDCFVVDLHTTTSNMGNTVILSHENPINLCVAQILSKNLPDTRVILSPDQERKYLASQSEFGMMIEVGPVANGVLNSVTLENTIKLLKEILNALSTLPNLTTGSVEIYEEIEDVFYPQSDGEISAYIHQSFQGRDFDLLEGEYAAFRTFEGVDINMKTEGALYPIFINEAAYYPTKLAFTLCRKRNLIY
jgi:succinylglutamate desuccinylase